MFKPFKTNDDCLDGLREVFSLYYLIVEFVSPFVEGEKPFFLNCAEFSCDAVIIFLSLSLWLVRIVRRRDT